MSKRTYIIQKYYAVLCSGCHADIADEDLQTQSEAEKTRDAHEAWHRDAEKRAARERKGPA